MDRKDTEASLHWKEIYFFIKAFKAALLHFFQTHGAAPVGTVTRLFTDSHRNPAARQHNAKLDHHEGRRGGEGEGWTWSYFSYSFFSWTGNSWVWNPHQQSRRRLERKAEHLQSFTATWLKRRHAGQTLRARERFWFFPPSSNRDIDTLKEGLEGAASNSPIRVTDVQEQIPRRNKPGDCGSDKRMESAVEIQYSFTNVQDALAWGGRRAWRWPAFHESLGRESWETNGGKCGKVWRLLHRLGVKAYT